jgi:hypothetical protein
MAVGDASERPDPPSTWALKKGALQVTRRPDTLVSPEGRPGPEQRRDLIGARRLPGVTPHSIVRPLPLRGLRTDRDIERSFLT